MNSFTVWPVIHPPDIPTITYTWYILWIVWVLYSVLLCTFLHLSFFRVYTSAFFSMEHRSVFFICMILLFHMWNIIPVDIMHTECPCWLLVYPIKRHMLCGHQTTRQRHTHTPILLTVRLVDNATLYYRTGNRRRHDWDGIEILMMLQTHTVYTPASTNKRNLHLP